MSFKNIFGQDQAVNILINEIKSNSIKHSYIFYGIEGIGKKFTALQFAKSLLCGQRLDFISCDVCDNCVKIDSRHHPDVIVVDSNYQEVILGKKDIKKNIKIDTIRYIKEQANLSPYFSKLKIFIIDQAETLQKEAVNSLLKILEEPPKHCIFILITSNLGILPKTLISRCEIIKFLPFNKNTFKNFSIHDNSKFVFNSTKDIFYHEKFSDLFNKNLNNLNIFDMQNMIEILKKDKNLTEYFICYLIKNFLRYKKNISENLISDYIFYLKIIRYNIDLTLLVETILSTIE